MIFLIKNNLKNILKNKLNCINKRSLIYDTKKKSIKTTQLITRELLLVGFQHQNFKVSGLLSRIQC
jgi:hypothetical protein